MQNFCTEICNMQNLNDKQMKKFKKMQNFCNKIFASKLAMCKSYENMTKFLQTMAIKECCKSKVCNYLNLTILAKRL